MKNLQCIGKMGSDGQLGLRPFWLIANVRQNTRYSNLTPGFVFMLLGCYEGGVEAVAGIPWFQWREFTCETVDVCYRDSKDYTVWIIAPTFPISHMKEAKEEMVRWVNERDLETCEDTHFAICLHDGLRDYQDTVAWWSLADAVIFTLREDVANEIVTSLNDRYKAIKNEEKELRNEFSANH